VAIAFNESALTKPSISAHVALRPQGAGYPTITSPVAPGNSAAKIASNGSKTFSNSNLASVADAPILSQSAEKVALLEVFGVQHPASVSLALAKVELVPVTSFVQFSDSILNGYSNGVYAYVNDSPKVPAAITEIALAAGTRLGDVAEMAPALAVQTFVKSTNAVGEYDYVAFTTASADMQNSSAVHAGVQQARMALNEGVSHTSVALPKVLVASENAVSTPGQTVQSIHTKAEDELLGMAGYASLSLNQSLSQLPKVSLLPTTQSTISLIRRRNKSHSIWTHRHAMRP
jgi:hypothetical protein